MAEVLKRMSQSTPQDGRVSLETMLHALGRRSFGPIILVGGLLTLAPVIGDIPGVPTLIGIVVFLLSVQFIAGRECPWLPRWLLARSASAQKVHKALAWLDKPARAIDRFLRPRLTGLTEGPAVRWIAASCTAISAAMPAMELVPFSANIAGAALTIFGLSLVAHDGLLALLGILLTVSAAWGALGLL